jgi:hypothetical protein
MSNAGNNQSTRDNELRRARRGTFTEIDRQLAESFDRLLTYRELSAVTGVPLGTLNEPARDQSASKDQPASNTDDDA